MQFEFTEEQHFIRDNARNFVRQHGTSERVRRAMESELGYDDDSWQQMITELGWCGVALPEAYGGVGLGQIELAIICEEMGRAMLPSPFFSTIALAANAIIEAGSEAQCSQLLSPIAAGETRAALAFTGNAGVAGVEGVEATLEAVDGGFELNGESSFVINGHTADLLVIAARTPGTQGSEGVSLIVLDPNTDGLEREKLSMMDLTRPMAKTRYSAIKVSADQILGEAGASGEALERALAKAAVALAAEQTGAAQASLEITTDYVKQRVQFGRLIGSFQAVKHRLADMMVLVEAAISAVYFAACNGDEGTEDFLELASVAKIQCSTATYRCAANMIQLHGGIGFTWEYDAHLFFKRAKASSSLLGSPDYHREKVAQLIGLGVNDAPIALNW